MIKGQPRQSLFQNTLKYKIVKDEDEKEQPYNYNGIVMIFRTKSGALNLLRELDKLYGKGFFSIRRYHE